MLRLGLEELKKHKFNEFQNGRVLLSWEKRYNLKMVENNSDDELEKFINEWDYFLKQNNKKLVVILNNQNLYQIHKIITVY